MNILAVVAHPDDEILGCGATLYRLHQEGHAISSVVLCAGADARANRPERLAEYAAEAAAMVGIEHRVNYSFPNIEFNAVAHIDIVRAVEQAILKFRPEWVFTHHAADLNIDHRVTHDATVAAVMLPQRQTQPIPTTMIKRVLLCEIPSSTDWAPPTAHPFQPNTFFDIRTAFEQKAAALQHFEGAMKPFPHSRSIENVRHLAYIRGAQAGLEMAEAFVTVRDVV